MGDNLTAVDLFCGGGGFSEGFRQAGIEVTHAVDIEEKACDTYELNAPDETEVLNKDMHELEPEDLPDDVDVLIGSPPCGEFSTSKRGGSGDAEKGMELVDRFLYFVHELDPDYWIMENVPRIEDHLSEYRGSGEGEIPDLDEGEEVHIKRCERFYSEEYGTPQRRTRVLSGDFPDPPKSDEPGPTLWDVQDTYWRPSERKGDGTQEDPVYDGLSVHVDKLSDHFYDSHLTNRECTEIRALKEDHSFYGPMSFPDERDNQSRTVIAMNRRISRETIVMEEESPPSDDPSMSKYRKPTIRELASIQGFPITYQFTGTTVAQKRRRVGDAVPPTMSYRLALGVLEDAGEDISDTTPSVAEEPPEIEYDLSDEENSPRARRRLPLTRNFRHHVPYDDMREFRVDLETGGEPYRHPLSKELDGDLEHPVRFRVVFYRGYAGEVEKETIPLDRSLAFVKEYVNANPSEKDRVREFMAAVGDTLDSLVPDATTLQGMRTRRAKSTEPREYKILEAISSRKEGEATELVISADEDDDGTKLVDQYFPRELYDIEEDTFSVDILDGTEIPIRTLMKMVAAQYAAHKLNHCGRWISRYPEEVYLPEEHGLDIDKIPDSLGCSSPFLGDRCIEDYFQRIANRGWDEALLVEEPGHAD